MSRWLRKVITLLYTYFLHFCLKRCMPVAQNSLLKRHRFSLALSFISSSSAKQRPRVLIIQGPKNESRRVLNRDCPQCYVTRSYPVLCNICKKTVLTPFCWTFLTRSAFFYTCTVHLDIIKVFFISPTDALYLYICLEVYYNLH
jgi:hypothetical protein